MQSTQGESNMEKQRKRTRYFVTVGMLSSIGFLLHLLNFPIPPFPAFLKVDFSDMPALLAVITMGPVAGILVEFFKNVLDWLFTGTETGVPVGHIANFTTGVLFIMPVYVIFNRFKSVKGLVAGLITGTVVMAVGMSILNYAVFLPMYTYFLGMEKVVGDALYVMIIKGILPFNIVKGIIITIIMVLLYQAMGKWIAMQQKAYRYQ